MGHALLIVLVVVAVALLLDRVLLFAEARGWVYWRKSPASRGSASGALGELIEVFQPSHQLLQEETRRREAGDAQDNLDEAIDLDSGTVVLRRDRPSVTGPGLPPARG